MKQIWTGGGGGGEEGGYNCNIAQAATQLPYALYVRAVIYRSYHVLLYPFLFSKIRSCDACQRVNRKMVISTPQLHPIPVKGIDFIGPVNPTSSQGNRYILTISDYFSKFVEAVPLPSKNADGVSNVLFKVYYCINCVINMIANRLTHIRSL